MAARGRVICASGALVEGGPGVRFTLAPGAPDEKGFAIRERGVVRAYVNRCPHLGVELDWQPGEFRDVTGLYLVCSTHGALFEPATGRCVAGPCRGAALEGLPVEEHYGEVHFHDDSPAPRPAGGDHP